MNGEVTDYRGRKKEHVLGEATNELKFEQVVLEAPEGNGGKKKIPSRIETKDWILGKGQRLVVEN